jgi:hypothetical protein
MHQLEQSDMTKGVCCRIFLALLFLSSFGSSKENKIIESQPEVLFEYKELNEAQEQVGLKVKFNRAVLYLEQKEYRKAINIFKQTQKILKIPSLLNIGIAYYRLNSHNNAYLYLKKIYDLKIVAQQEPYSYMSAAYYLYKLTNDKIFIENIIKIVEKKRRLTEHTKRLVVDVYIELKQYKKALSIALDIQYPNQLKIALLYIKIKDYENAIIYLEKALKVAANDDIANKILWFKVFVNLKSNKTARLHDDIIKIQKRQKIFNTNIQMPIKLYFNKNKFMAKEYFDMVTRFNSNRKIDFIFYFAPFIFADNDAIEMEESKAFVLKDRGDLNDLDKMVDYNKKFIELIKKDPIERTNKLKEYLENRYDTHSYKYYNLALSFAQCDDFHNAHKYFKKAYSLNKGNKLFAAMTLISAKRLRLNIPKEEYKNIRSNLLSKGGSYHYFGQFIYKIIYDDKLIPKQDRLTNKFKKSIFYRGLYFLDKVDEKGIRQNEPLLQEFDKDPLVYMFKLIAREEDESDYQYIARIQDNIPVKYNTLFIRGPLVITRYYLDILKALGMLDIADLNLDTDTSATYLRTKALVQLYEDNPKATVSIIEHLQQKYKIEDRYTYLLLVAAMIDMKDFQNAYVTLAIAQRVLKNDVDINFLMGLRLLQELKINSAMKYFKNNKYDGDLIDFKLVGLDQFLKEL